MAWSFRKPKNSAALPEEVQQYYEGERRSRTGRAWLLALGTLLATLLIAFALFWTGRWVYRVVTNGDDKKTPTITQPAKDNKGTSSTSTNKPSGNQNGGQSGQSSQSSTTQSGTSSGTTGSSRGQTPSSVPNTGQTMPTELANTGPEHPDPDL